jgi:hypothetical protein
MRRLNAVFEHQQSRPRSISGTTTNVLRRSNAAIRR